MFDARWIKPVAIGYAALCVICAFGQGLLYSSFGAFFEGLLLGPWLIAVFVVGALPPLLGPVIILLAPFTFIATVWWRFGRGWRIFFFPLVMLLTGVLLGALTEYLGVWHVTYVLDLWHDFYGHGFLALNREERVLRVAMNGLTWMGLTYFGTLIWQYFKFKKQANEPMPSV